MTGRNREGLALFAQALNESRHFSYPQVDVARTSLDLGLAWLWAAYDFDQSRRLTLSVLPTLAAAGAAPGSFGRTLN